MSRVTQGWGAGQTCALCHGFAKIPPLIRGTDGKSHLNPDFEMVKAFQVRAEPFDFAIPAGGTQVFAITPPAEGQSAGDFLISEFRGLFGPAGARDLAFEFLNMQDEKLFQNAPVFNTLIMGNAHLNCCLPCCTLVQAENTLQVQVTNNEAVPVTVGITAVGKRFLPPSEELRSAMLSYWNTIPSYPYFLTLDDQQVAVAAGTQATAFMTVPGTGDFELMWPRTEVRPDGGAVPNPDTIFVTVAEGIGRLLQSDPLPLGSFIATPTLTVAGFPGGLYRAASACHCPPASQLFKRNTRVRVTFDNRGPDDAIVRLTYAGCFHRVDECPPGRSIDRIRSLEPTIGPIQIPQGNYCAPAQPAPPVPVSVPGTAAAYPYGTAQNTPQRQAAQGGAGYGYVPPNPGRRSMVVPGVGLIWEGSSGALEYMWKSYDPGPGGVPVPKHGAAYGMGGMQGGVAAHQLVPGTQYYDPLSNSWRTA